MWEESAATSFFALMTNVSGIEEIRQKAQEVLDAVQTICVNFSSVPVSVSIGISLYPEDGKTLKALYAQADGALYDAKRKGKSQFVFASL